jgi:hypothetical protein
MTPKTISEFYTELDLLTSNKFTNVDSGKKVRYINRALLNLADRIKGYSPEVFSKVTTITGVNGTATLPSDFDTTSRGDFLIFFDDSRLAPMGSADVRIFGNTLRGVPDGTLYLEYSKEPSRYTAIGDTILETSSVRVLEMLQTEVEFLRDSDIRQGQISNQAQSARIKTVEIS